MIKDNGSVDYGKWSIVDDNGSGLVRDKEDEHDIIDDPMSSSFRGGKCLRTVSWHLKWSRISSCGYRTF